MNNTWMIKNSRGLVYARGLSETAARNKANLMNYQDEPLDKWYAVDEIKDNRSGAPEK